MDHGDDQAAGSRPSDLPRRMPDVRTYCDDDVVHQLMASGRSEMLTTGNVWCRNAAVDPIFHIPILWFQIICQCHFLRALCNKESGIKFTKEMITHFTSERSSPGQTRRPNVHRLSTLSSLKTFNDNNIKEYSIYARKRHSVKIYTNTCKYSVMIKDKSDGLSQTTWARTVALIEFCSPQHTVMKQCQETKICLTAVQTNVLCYQQKSAKMDPQQRFAATLIQGNSNSNHKQSQVSVGIGNGRYLFQHRCRY